MDSVNLWIGAAALLITVASFGYAIYSSKRGDRRKSLVYEVLPPAPLADAVSPRPGFSVALTYEEAGEAPVTVSSIFVQYLRFANFGRLPIRSEDSAQVDPLRVVAAGGRPLSLSLVGTSRAVCQVSLPSSERDGDRLTGELRFDFLDYRDGGLVQVVSESSATNVALEGTIIGMPDGLVRAKQPRDEVSFPDFGCLAPLLAALGCLVATPFIYRHFVGSWDNVWLLLLPLGAVVLPLVLTLPVMFFSMTRSRFPFASPLEPPHQYFARLHMYSKPMSRRHRERREERVRTQQAWSSEMDPHTHRAHGPFLQSMSSAGQQAASADAHGAAKQERRPNRRS